MTAGPAGHRMAVVARGSRLHRLAAALILVITAPVLHASAACRGWAGSPAARMACCQAAAGHCAAVSADDCCADTEQRRNLETVSVTLTAPGYAASAIVPDLSPARRPVPTPHLPARPATYLLDAVLLI